MKNVLPPLGQITQRGERIYGERLRERLEPGENGKFAVINVDTGEYELDANHLAASKRAAARWPGGLLFAVRVGSATVGHIGGRFRVKAEQVMIRGKVLASGEAVVTLKVRGPNGLIGQIETMVDTGFNDALTLPPDVIEKLGLPFSHEANYTLADGVKSATRIFGGEIEWDGAWRELLVVEIDGDPLLGMVMMRGCNLSIDVVDGGSVMISPLAG